MLPAVQIQLQPPRDVAEITTNFAKSSTKFVAKCVWNLPDPTHPSAVSENSGGNVKSKGEPVPFCGGQVKGSGSPQPMAIW
jgi:hypothetical protein